eukprot:CAMPEP_0181469084 /NCGR_PEP_ID=MMETSP1110-20121109/37827_1 /TAXON_ID=174948 /ORGANISM="Symbiodinium sp., Strain CCMP421" /LENGTH=130 /DNA_ID=CAMNT_0023593961 /DNA_START=338 /DNA_END=727 /DNA_ORIENTATION=+
MDSRLALHKLIEVLVAPVGIHADVSSMKVVNIRPGPWFRGGQCSVALWPHVFPVPAGLVLVIFLTWVDLVARVQQNDAASAVKSCVHQSQSIPDILAITSMARIRQLPGLLDETLLYLGRRQQVKACSDT